MSIVDEWIQKAEGDFQTAEREMRARKAVNYDAVCFHCQQCAEKYLKGFIIQHNLTFKPIHDLETLLGWITPTHPQFDSIRDPLLLLNDYAVDIRYPGDYADREEASEAAKAMRRVRDFVRQQLRLKSKVSGTAQ